MKVQIPLQLKRKYGLMTIFDEPVILHSHHYNAFLQKMLLSQNIEMKSELVDTASAVSFYQLKKLYEYNDANTYEERLAIAMGLFKILGLGTLNFSRFNEHLVTTPPQNHYAYAWESKFDKHPNYGVCFLVAGFIAAAIASAAEEPIGSYEVTEEECSAFQGHDHCIFRVKRLTSPRKLPLTPQIGILDHEEIMRHYNENVEEQNLYKILGKMEIKGNEEGLIPRFGLVLTRNYANYYNLLSNTFYEKMAQEKLQGDILASRLLIESGQEGGFFMFGKLMKSNEWYSLIHPLLDTKEEWIYGCVAWINALGWGIWDVQEIIPNEKLVLRVHEGYESNGYIALHGNESKVPRCFMATGAANSLASLIYYQDISKQPTLSDSLYRETYSGNDCFEAKETKCRCMGDHYCEIIVERNKSASA